MTVKDDILTALKTGNIVFGYRESIKLIKLRSPKLIVISNNIAEEIRKDIEHNAKIGKIKLEVFEGSSKDLGIFCGKPFPVSALVVE